MKELILPPASKKPKDAWTDRPGEIFIDPSERRFSGQRGRRPGAVLILAALAVAGAYAVYRAADAPKSAQAATMQAALIEKTQQQVAALQTEVRELRAKLEAAETRLAASPVVPSPVAPSPAADAKADAAPAPMSAAPIAETAPAKGAASEAAPVQTVPQSPKSVAGYKLREVANGVAILETRRGVVAVRVGDNLAEFGPVSSIQKRAGRWVVSTAGGDIVGEAQARPAAPRRRPVNREQYGYMPERFMPRLFMPF